MNNNVSIEDAIQALLSRSHPCPVEKVSLYNAPGRILAEDLCARIDLPPFHRSAYDGFAIKCSETKDACVDSPVIFEVTQAITAGDFSTTPLGKGCAARIMTGAALPEGADCVINFERVTEKDSKVFLYTPLSPWQNVDRAGNEMSVGTGLFSRGEYLSPSHLGVLASQGFSAIPVYEKPRAVILSTGSELLSPGTAYTNGKIYNSNLYVFRALLEQEGFQTEDGIQLSDEKDLISDTIRELSSRTDLIIMTGGASVGDKDFAHRALQNAGADILFAHIAMKPGSCCYGAVLNDTLILSLSGNPGAALTTYYRAALPAIRKMAGQRYYMLHEEWMPLSSACRKTCPQPRILKGHTEISDGIVSFVEHAGQFNSMQTSFLNMNALAQLPPTDNPTEAGTMVRVFIP